MSTGSSESGHGPERGPLERGPRSLPPASPLAMDVESMRRLGYQAVDAVVERAAQLGSEPPWRYGSRAELEALFRESAPEEGSPPEEVLRRAVEEILPIAGRIDHPRFFAFVPVSPTWPSVLADVLCSGFNVFQGTWLESAGPSQVELVVLDWFREWLGYPEGAGGLFTSGGSAANLDALHTALETAGRPEQPVIYVNDQGHSSILRAARIVGVPPERVREIPTDGSFRMVVEELRSAVAADRRAGLDPLCVCANGGATNTGAVDPLTQLGRLSRDEGLWLHVDAAYGGFTILTDGGAAALEGIAGADSVTLDPHKWLFQPYETGCLMVRDIRTLEGAFRILPEYLQDTRLGERQVNFADRGLQLTRSFRALRVWMSVKTFGLGAFRKAIQDGMDLAVRAGEYVGASKGLELLSPPALGVVCFRYNAGTNATSDDLEQLNLSIQNRIVEEGTAMMSSTRLSGIYALRLCILNFHSKWEDVRRTLARVEELGAAMTS